MTRDLCAVCGKRGDRRCPALDRHVCSRCCGTERGRTVRCLPECPFWRAAEGRLQERRARELERAWAAWYRELAVAGKGGIWPHIEVLAQALTAVLHRGPTTDGEVEAALRYLDQALSPIVLVPASPPPLGRILAEEGFLPLVDEGKVEREKLREAVQAVIEWLPTFRSVEDPLRFVRGLRGLFAPLPREEPGLIARPRGPV